MLASQIPAKFTEPFANNASSPFIRTIPATSIDPTVASLSLGFPPDTATPVGAGGTPPDIADFNGILNPATAWNQWQSAGGPVFYDSVFSAAIGGYPKGALLDATSGVGAYWISAVDNNTSDPDTGGANWDGVVLVGLGTAAYKVASDNSKASVASVSGSITAGHVAVFSDTAGTIEDGGAPSVDLPTGFPFDWLLDTPPAGALVRDGSSLSTTTYAALFAIIGYNYGGSGGSFSLPDDRGLFIREWDDGAGVDPGRTFGDVQLSTFEFHSHNTGIGSIDTTTAVYGFTTSGIPGGASSGVYQRQAATATRQTVTSSLGGSETRGINRAYLPCIQY